MYIERRCNKAGQARFNSPSFKQSRRLLLLKESAVKHQGISVKGQYYENNSKYIS